MSYRDFLDQDRAEQIHLGVPWHDPVANKGRQRRAEKIIEEHTADVNRAYEQAPPGAEPYVPQAPFGTYVLARNGGDVRDALSGAHDVELRAHIDEALHFPDDRQQTAHGELEATKQRVFGDLGEPVPSPATTPPTAEFPDPVLIAPAPATQGHQRDVREAAEAASAAEAADAAGPGGEGEARQARGAALRAATSLSSAPARSAGAEREGRTPQQEQAAAAVLASRERGRAEHAADQLEEPGQRARDSYRDYPSMDERDATAAEQRGPSLGRP